MGRAMTDSSQAAESFVTLADAEESQVPMYARLCRAIADRPEVAGLLLEAPVAQRLPVLLLAALHEAVLLDPDSALAPWYPSVGGDAGLSGDLGAALDATLRDHWERIRTTVASRQVQTNEVNRCVAWRAGLALMCRGDDRQLALVELGSSAGLNLGVDRYLISFDSGGDVEAVGPADSPVRLRTSLRTGSWPALTAPIPPVAERIGIDLSPLDPTDSDDTRWLTACVWPEQLLRLERLKAALDATAAAPPHVLRGDLVDRLDDAFDLVGDDRHVVVLSSWALGYLPRDRRASLQRRLALLAGRCADRGSRLTVLTLEADHVVPWTPTPALRSDAPPELRHASLLASTGFDHRGRTESTALARCQAHLAWVERLNPGTAA